MSIRLEYPEGATPIDPDEMEGLIPKGITLQKELNDFEHINIQDARLWLSRKKPKDVLSDAFIKKLHKRMFGNVWKWAGQYRLTEKTIGIDPFQIPVQIRELCKNTEFQIQNLGSGSWEDELAVRFHHRLVLIHPFPNGNGRHSREMTDVLLTLHGQERFTWGDTNQGVGIVEAGKQRATYIEALKDADQGRFTKLIQFVRS